MEINKFEGTVGSVILKYKGEIDECYNRKGDLINKLKTIFDLEKLNDNPYTFKVIENLNNKKDLNSQIMYIYNILTAGFGLKVC